MKRLAMLAGVLALGLGACTQNGGVNIGQGFGMGASISGAVVAVTFVPATATTSATATATSTAPTVTFNAYQQSLGLNIQSYSVEVLDGAGVDYAGTDGKYQQSVSYRVQPGFVCASGSIDTCAPTDKVASPVSTSLGPISLVSAAVVQDILNDCVTKSACPSLRMKVTFSGVDDAGRTQTVVSNAAAINITTN